METHRSEPTSDQISRTPAQSPPPDQGLRRMLTWVFAALGLTVLFAILVVELTLRWFD
jgi:hypothetical protein